MIATAVPSESTFTSPPSAQNRGRTGGQIYYAPKESITDSTLLNKGYQARARVIGSKEQSEPLDPRKPFMNTAAKRILNFNGRLCTPIQAAFVLYSRTSTLISFGLWSVG